MTRGRHAGHKVRLGSSKELPLGLRGGRSKVAQKCHTLAGGPMSAKLELSKLSLMDALDLATLIEVEAHKRYTQFAERLGSSAEGDAASVFESMAVNENKHGEQIAERRIALFGDQRPRVKITDIFEVEAP